MLLIVTTEFPPYPGGIATYSYQMASNWANLGVPLHVLATVRSEVAHYEDYAAFDGRQAFTVQRFHNPRIRVLRPVVRALETVSCCLRKRPRAIFCCTLASAYGALLCKILWGVPYYLVGIGSEYTRKLPLTAVVLRRAKRLFAISNYTADLMRKHTKVPIVVIPIGADADTFEPTPIETRSERHQALGRRYGINGAPVLLSVGRLNARKGHDITLEALAKVCAVYPQVQMVIVGRSTEEGKEYEASLHEFLEEAGLKRNVVFIPMIASDDLPALYEMADVCILASRQDGANVEGFGIVLIEANLMATAVIGSRTGGIVDAVEDGKSGLLFECENSKDLAQKLMRLLGDDALRKSLGQHGRERALQTFNWRTVARRTWAAMGRTSAELG